MVFGIQPRRHLRGMFEIATRNLNCVSRETTIRDGIPTQSIRVDLERRGVGWYSVGRHMALAVYLRSKNHRQQRD